MLDRMPAAPPRDDPRWGWEFTVENFVFARLDDDRAAADTLTDQADREHAHARIAALRHLAALHSIYVGADGENWCRCFSCEPGSGVPCATIRLLAQQWSQHPDLPDAATGPVISSLDDVAAAGGFAAHYQQQKHAAPRTPGDAAGSRSSTASPGGD